MKFFYMPMAKENKTEYNKRIILLKVHFYSKTVRRLNIGGKDCCNGLSEDGPPLDIMNKCSDK